MRAKVFKRNCLDHSWVVFLFDSNRGQVREIIGYQCWEHAFSKALNLVGIR